MKNFSRFLVLISFICISCHNNAYSSLDDNYSFNMDDCPEESEVVAYNMMNDKYPSEPTATKKLTVKKAEDISGIACWDSEYDHYYLLGVYTDETHLIRASQLKCYNGTYNSLFFKWCLKEEEDHYFERYVGSYHNYQGDELVVKKNEIKWTYSFDKDYKITFKCTGLINNETFSPYAQKFYINGKEFKNTDGLKVSFSISNLFFTDMERSGYDSLKISINPNQVVLKTFLNQYLESAKSKYRYDEELSSVIADSCYYADNNVTIKYDL